MSKDQELVLGFDEKYMSGFCSLASSDTADPFKGFSRDVPYLRYALEKSYYKLRGEAESDTSFKQIIPYVVLTTGTRYLSYERCGSESRLSKKISIGIGGHVNPVDIAGSEPIMYHTIQNAAKREFNEELSLGDMPKPSQDLIIATSLYSSPFGIVYAGNCSEVDAVHIGVVFRMGLRPEAVPTVSILDEGKNLSWRTKEDLLKEKELEKWSRMVLEAL